MKKFVNIILLVILLIMSIMNCILATKLADKTEELIELTNVEPELIIVDSIVFDTVFIEKYENVRLPIYNTDTILINDTILVIDSADVVIPIELKHYHDTLSSTAFSFDVQGFQCEIKDLSIQNLISCPDHEKPLKTKPFGLGVQLGVGASKNGLSPYIGIGVSYNIFQF